MRRCSKPWRLDQTTAELPVILITTDANEKDVRSSVERGAADFLVKPVDPHTVQERVCAVVREAWPPKTTILDCSQEEETPHPVNEPRRTLLPTELTMEESEELARLWFRKLEGLCRFRPALALDCAVRTMKGEVGSILTEEMAGLLEETQQLRAALL